MKTSMIPMDATISNIRAYGNGWMWDVTGVDLTTNEKVIITYRTNQIGEGVWEMGEAGDESQYIGTSQFHTSQNISSARRQISKFFTEAA